MSASRGSTWARSASLAAALLCASPDALAARPDAVPFLFMPPTSKLASGSNFALEPAFENLGFANPVFMIPEPAGNRIWVAEQAGRILSFVAEPGVTESRVVLDIRDVTAGEGDSGLLSFAFHPSFAVEGSPAEGWLFVAYEFHDLEAEGTPLHFRLSRFRVSPNTGIANRESERILIDQLDQSPWHEGGALLFRPSDGYLYLTVGDEGGGRCQHLNCQRIDKDLFSGVLRLDVDRLGGEVSHEPPEQPETGETDGYYIPHDNPFVGEDEVLEEFYAIGLRSPHRMTLDPVEDRIWIADVGQSQREEIDVLSRGANFQWNVMEGSIPLDAASEIPDPVIGEWTAPIHDYGRSVGGTIIGGYVYRGLALPELEGRYLFTDFLSGKISSLRYTTSGGAVELKEVEVLVETPHGGRSDGITSFGIDAEGELYVLTLGEAARLQKLVRAERDPGTMPLTLSATGLFEDLATLTAIPSLVPYEVRVPLWSDGAAKRRWMSVPSGATIDYSADSPWLFPPGTVFVKHFEMQLDKAEPGSVKRLETRVLVVQQDGQVYGVTYKWRDDQSDADLLTFGQFEDLTVRDLEGEQRVQRYLYPSPADCLTCHDQGAGFVLGLRARQLDGVPAGEVEDQLERLAADAFLDVTSAELDRVAIPEFAPLTDETAGFELRARSYLDVNCSQCHGGQDLDRARWDARITTPLNRQGIVMGPLLGDYGSAEDRVIVPGDLGHSVLHLRTSTEDADLRMPPLARSVTDDTFVTVLEGWIAGMTATTLPPILCGDSSAPFNEVSVSDALLTLNSAVGLKNCLSCLCDVNASGTVTVTDALRVLIRSVGSQIDLDCPPCI